MTLGEALMRLGGPGEGITFGDGNLEPGGLHRHVEALEFSRSRLRRHRLLGPAKTDFVVLACPKPPNPAVVTILLPEDRIDVSLGIERRNEIVSMA
jgi:hypothetical protein